MGTTNESLMNIRKKLINTSYKVLTLAYSPLPIATHAVSGLYRLVMREKRKTPEDEIKEKRKNLIMFFEGYKPYGDEVSKSF